MEIKGITRRWGGSIAIVIPKEIVEQQNIREDEALLMTIERERPKAGVLWGFGKGKFKKSAQEIKDGLRAGWLSSSDREREERWKKKNQK